VIEPASRGTLRGETIKYDLKTGRLDGGGDGSRVKMRIMPKTGRRLMLTARGLRKRYKSREVVHDFGLELGPGEVVGLLGPERRRARPPAST
jgi:hypothetical protein